MAEGSIDSSWFTPYLRALEISKVPEANRRWCVIWVERFAKFIKEKPLPSAVRENAESFIDSLKSTSGTDAWKIEQATSAVRLLLTAVYDKRWEPVTILSKRNTKDGGLDPLRAVCRARGYSRKTETARR